MKISYSDSFSLNQKEYIENCQQVSQLSLIAAGFHFIQCIVLLVLIFTKPNFGDLTADLTISENRVPIFKVHIAWLCASFFMVSGLSSLFQGNGAYYQQSILRNCNPARWIEYSISSGIAICIVAILASVRDLTAIVSIFGMNLIMNLSCAMMDKINKPAEVACSIKWEPLLLSLIIALWQWMCIFVMLIYGPTIPAHSYVISLSYLFLYGLFACNTVFHFSGSFRDGTTFKSEICYIALNLAAKTFIGWAVFVAIGQG
jgi:hypothetical protein